MKKIILLILILKFSTGIALSQIDTTEYFPLKTGNYWEFWGIDNLQTKWVFMSIGCIKDTLLSNGKNYMTLEQKTYLDSLNPEIKYFFYRSENKKLFEFYSDDFCPLKEIALFDFTISDSSIWEICSNYFANHRGIYNTANYYNPILNLVYEGKKFDWVNIDGQDTLWSPFGSPGITKIGKGIGFIQMLYWDFAEFNVTGARIHNQVYGNLTDIELSDPISITFNLFQNYPNPFNPVTQITYTVKEVGFIKLKVFDVLGKDVTTLVNKEQSAGIYKVEFNGSDLATGIYFYQLNVGNFVETKKMILVK